jgi:hypothetical protein
MEHLSVTQAAFQNILFFAIGAYLAGVGWRSAQGVQRILRQLKIADGRVLRCAATQLSTDPRHVAYAVAIEFSMPNGIRRKVNHIVWSNHGAVYQPGETISVWYDPEWPERAEIENPRKNLVGAAMAACLGMMMMVMLAIHSIGTVL